MDVRLRMLERLKELGFDFNQFSMDDFVAHVAKQLEREIRLIGWEMPQGMYGAWISIDDVAHEYVFYNTIYSRHQQVNSQLHELCHIICGHPTLKISRARLGELLDGGDLDTVFEKALLRSPDTSQEEVEAETMAILVQESAANCDRLKQLMMPSTNEHSLRYLEKVGFARV